MAILGFFSKGLTHDFGQKLKIYPFCYFEQNRTRNLVFFIKYENKVSQFPCFGTKWAQNQFLMIIYMQLKKTKTSPPQSVSQSVSQSVIQSVSQPVSQQVSQAVSQSVSPQPVRQSVIQPISQSVSQSSCHVSQPVSQSTSQFSQSVRQFNIKSVSQ